MGHAITLQRGTVNMLTNMLQKAGWYGGDVRAAYCGGKVLTEVLPDLSGDQPPTIDKPGGKQEIAPEAAQWLQETFDLTFTEAQREAVKLCVQSSIDRSALPINDYTMEMMDKFGLV